jgi:hypothetical protein
MGDTVRSLDYAYAGRELTMFHRSQQIRHTTHSPKVRLISPESWAIILTHLSGRPVQDPTTSTILRGTHGRLRGGLSLLEDTQLIEILTHFPRERIPERTVHAKAAGAWGEFEVTHDISHITSCNFLTGVGKKTPLLARLSTVGGEKGSADTLRDIRGEYRCVRGFGETYADPCTRCFLRVRRQVLHRGRQP